MINIKEFKKSIKAHVINTVEYAEAESKESFLVGFELCFSKMEESIQLLQTRITIGELYNDELVEDLERLSTIIFKYKSEE